MKWKDCYINMKLGIVGLPNVGKSTLFNAITNAGAGAANYPFCTIEPNIGTVTVPDKRVDALTELYKSKSTVYAVIEFVDIAGLVKGASKGEGLGNKFLATIREVDAIVHVVRCFEDGDIIHVNGEIGPQSDIETINLELVFSDIDVLTRRIDRLIRQGKGDKKMIAQADFYRKVKEHLEEGLSARSYDCENEEEVAMIAEAELLSAKPIIYAANMGENDFSDELATNPYYKQVCDIATEEHAEVLPICARLEEEISDMELEEKLMFLNELGLNESGLDRLIKSCYKLLGLISYLTAGEDEVRAWTITRETKAPQAAGKIHTDFERGFIRAEIISYKDLDEYKSMVKAKEKGLVRLEGKEYVVQDGDIINFRFNV